MDRIYEKNPQILNNFLNYLLGIKNYSLKTIKAYNSSLYMFFEFIISYMHLKINVKNINSLILLQVNESHIIAFLVYCNFTRNNTPNTRKSKLAAIRKFYKWFLTTIPGGYTRENPTKNMPNIEGIRRLPKFLKLEQAKKIQEIFTLENSRMPIRNNALISTFLSTGARVSELINANVEDVNFNNNTITVIGKGNKERILYINEKSRNSLKRYLEQRYRTKKIFNLNEPLFLNKNGRRLGIDGVEDICSKAFELIGLGDCNYTSHTLRHTAATMMYWYVTQDILLLKEFLGHKYITSTEIYTHIYNKKLKEAIDKHPLNNYEKTENREEEAA